MRIAAAPLVTALLFALACGSAAAQWKWRDANGRINASDLPPPASVPSRVLTQDASASAPKGCHSRGVRYSLSDVPVTARSSTVNTTVWLEA